MLLFTVTAWTVIDIYVVWSLLAVEQTGDDRDSLNLKPYLTEQLYLTQLKKTQKQRFFGLFLWRFVQ